ncbi:hypothetical protein ACT7DG_10665 [Bacillus cereus]
MGKLGSLPRTREKRSYDVRTNDKLVVWIYIGTQGILQGTYETFGEAARQHFDGSLKGTLTLTAWFRWYGWCTTSCCNDERRCCHCY